LTDKLYSTAAKSCPARLRIAIKAAITVKITVLPGRENVLPFNFIMANVKKYTAYLKTIVLKKC